MNLVKCPCCGTLFDADNQDSVISMSPVAASLLKSAPEKFKRGKPYSVRKLAEVVGYSETHVRRGLSELEEQGYVRRTNYGQGIRAQYAGVPEMFLTELVSRL